LATKAPAHTGHTERRRVMPEGNAHTRQAQTYQPSPEPEATREEVQPLYLTYRQAETVTGLSRTTLWRIVVKEGRVRYVRVGRALRIDRRSLEAYMEGAADA
jgi:excisionase family DNA binding protein